MDLSDEEEREEQAISVFLSKFKKLFRYLFTTYANTCYTNHKPHFEDLKEKYDLITFGELTILLKDHSLDNWKITKDELATILRLVNIKYQRSDLSSLTFEGFQDCLVQIAIFIFGKQPKFMQLPLVESLKELLLNFEKAEEIQGKSLTLYHNPDATALGDQALIEALNKLIFTNPSYTLPEGYTKKVVKTVTFAYKFNKSLSRIPEKMRICVEILDEVIESFSPGTHFLESRTVCESNLKVYPKIIRPEKRLMPLKYMDEIDKGPRQKPESTSQSFNSKKSYYQGRSNLSVAIRIAVAQLPRELKGFGIEVGEVLDEIIKAVENGKSSLEDTKEKNVLNNAVKARIQEAMQYTNYEAEKETKRKSRHENLKRKLEEIRLKEVFPFLFIIIICRKLLGKQKEKLRKKRKSSN